MKVLLFLLSGLKRVMKSMHSNSALNLLIVEDEANLGDTLFDYLESKGHQCKLATNIKEAKEIFNNNHINVILMDINLPDGNGIELAKELRGVRKDFVLLFLSAMNDPETRLQGLELGAEDYITKPFDLRELNLRLNRILETKLKFDKQKDEIDLEDLKIWFSRYEVLDGNGLILQLSQKECAILELLYQDKNKVVSRESIIENIWGEGAFPSNRTVDNYIVKLRKWLETSKDKKVLISSVRGIGYRLEIKI